MDYEGQKLAFEDDTKQLAKEAKWVLELLLCWSEQPDDVEIFTSRKWTYVQMAESAESAQELHLG